MSYNLKSNVLKEEFLFAKTSRVSLLSVQDASNYYKSNNVPKERMYFQILIGYVSSLGEIANDKIVNLDLDLRYNTVKNLPMVIAYGFNGWANCSTDERIDISAKSLAAYLMLLCVNEHNCGIEITTPAIYTTEIFNHGWSGAYVSTGTKQKKDLLKIAKESVKFESNTLTIDTEKLIAAYKEMTGVDLSKYGLDGVEVSFQ